MEKILNFKEPLDVQVFDNIVMCMYQGKQSEIASAQKILTQFQQHPDAWTRVNTILQQSQNINSKFIALQILLSTIKYKWNVLPQQQRDGIKNFIVNQAIQKSSNEQTLQQERVYVTKLNEVLVQIVKQEWPHHWRNFIPDIVGSSKTNQSLCENNMNILKMLCGKMTQQKIKQLKESFQNEFSMVFQLCEFILENGKKPSLINATLRTLLRFVSWISLNYIFETKLLESLISKFLPVNMFRNDTLRCLTEIAGIDAVQYETKFEQLFFFTMKSLSKLLPPNANIPQAYSSGVDYDQKFIQILALFLTTFFKKHLRSVEKQHYREALMLAHNYLVEISKVDDTEIFKTCLEYWNFLAQDLFFTEKPQSQMQNTFPLMITDNQSRRGIYQQILSKVRTVMVSKMAKPEEVIIVEDENGDIVKEYMKDVDAIQLYKSMKETLVFLTHLDYADTEQIMITKLQNQVNGSEWSWNNLNTLCWAIGSISGAMEEKDEKRFLVLVIRDLLGLCDVKKGKQNKAVIASNIMYVVGQYPRFLMAHWKFLKTVVNKLFEFMHEDFPGVQEMACDTFLKISKRCRRKFVVMHQNETKPFIDELLDELAHIISDLEPKHIQTFYEAVGFMISVADTETKQNLLKRLMQIQNSRWLTIMQSATRSLENLKEPDLCRELVNLLKTNVSTAKSVGTAFSYQIHHIFKDMLQVYKVYSQMISQEVAKHGAVATKYSNVKNMRSVKKETLRLVETFVQNTKEEQTISTQFIPPLLEATLGDYKNSVPDARDPQVLSLLASCVAKLKSQLVNELPKILEYVLECTLPMITKNFEDYPEHRLNLFNLLREINKNCFQAFFKIPPQGFKLIIDSILWAVKHTHRTIYETGLLILQEMLINIDNLHVPQTQAGFYQSFYIPILNDMFYILTDTFHLSSFKTQVPILSHMFSTVQKVNVPIYDQSKYPRGISNVDFLKDYISKLLTKSFPNMSSSVIQQFVHGLFVLCNNPDGSLFKNHLRDFLVQMKEFSPQEQNDLFYEQRKQQEAALEQKMKQVPGLHAQEDNNTIQPD